MKNIKYNFACILFLSLVSRYLAQAPHPQLINSESYQSGIRDFLQKSPWQFHIGYVIIDDDGKPLSELLKAVNFRQFMVFPTKLGIEKRISDRWSAQGNFVFTAAKQGRLLNGEVSGSTQHLLAIDFAAKSQISQALFYTSWFKPYYSLGFGYTQKSYSQYQKNVTLNLAFGSDFWIQEGVFAVSMQTQSKFGLHAPFIHNSSNYLQHSLALVYNFDRHHKEYRRSLQKLRAIF